VDCSFSFAPSLYLRGDVHPDPGDGRDRNRPHDVFPNINIPVVRIIWNYNSLIPKEMSDRIISITVRNLTTVVGNIQHIESQSFYGIAVVKVFMQPNASIDRAVAQITASSKTPLRQLAPRHNASSRPCIQRVDPQQTFAASYKLEANGETLVLQHLAAAHTDTDIYIRFQKANVIQMGDLFFNGMYPYIAPGNFSATITTAPGEPN
jgi:hypothetical protein